MDFVNKLWGVLAVQQDSTPGTFNWKDLVHTLRIATATAVIVFLKEVDSHNFGIVDKMVTVGILALVTAVEALKVDNS